MSSVLYRQSRNCLYTSLNSHRNQALNRSVQTIFKLYHNTAVRAIPKLILKTEPNDSSTISTTLPNIDSPKTSSTKTINHNQSYIKKSNKCILLPRDLIEKFIERIRNKERLSTQLSLNRCMQLIQYYFKFSISLFYFL